ncbi:TatD family hydrolase [Flavobacterium sp.]|uniref:TatD family hydrolase n=1 Tax=Flavobacterium sp. TaxID=239 RepID=UPI003B9D01B7
MLIDTHIHLYSQEFENQESELIQQAFDSGVSHFVLPAIDSSSHAGMKRLKQQYPDQVSLMMGLHPCYVKHNFRDELAIVYTELKKGGYMAVGEIGVDLYWDTSTLNWQLEAFRTQIDWALELDLPINIHCREAFNEIFEVLESYRNSGLRGIFHCFTGNLQQAKQAVDLGLKLGIGGVATFKNGKIDQFLREIPISEIVLETDGPYLAPVPHRGKRNDPAYLRLIAEKVAGIYGISFPEAAEKTTLNAKAIYKI